jgi:hypothetical protein
MRRLVRVDPDHHCHLCSFIVTDMRTEAGMSDNRDSSGLCG